MTDRTVLVDQVRAAERLAAVGAFVTGSVIDFSRGRELLDVWAEIVRVVLPLADSDVANDPVAVTPIADAVASRLQALSPDPFDSYDGDRDELLADLGEQLAHVVWLLDEVVDRVSAGTIARDASHRAGMNEALQHLRARIADLDDLVRICNERAGSEDRAVAAAVADLEEKADRDAERIARALFRALVSHLGDDAPPWAAVDPGRRAALIDEAHALLYPDKPIRQTDPE